MNPNITVSYMAEQINRGRLDDVAARGSLIDEAYAAGSHPLGPVPVPVILGAALIRLGEWIQGTVRPSPTLAEPAALSAR